MLTFYLKKGNFAMFRDSAMFRETPVESFFGINGTLTKVTHSLFCLGNEKKISECQHRISHNRKCRDYNIICSNCKDFFFFKCKIYIFTICMYYICTQRIFFRQNILYEAVGYRDVGYDFLQRQIGFSEMKKAIIMYLRFY